MKKLKLIDCIKVGDKVFDVHRGWGIVEFIYTDSEYPILVHFEKHSSNADYTADGRLHDLDINPSLFLNEIKLEQELPEFIEGEIVLAKRRIFCDVYNIYYDDWVAAIYKRFNKPTNTYICQNLDKQLDFVFIAVKSFDISHFTK